MTVQASVSYVPNVGRARPIVAIRVTADPGKGVDIIVVDMETNATIATTTGVAVEDVRDPRTFHYDTADISGLDLETVGPRELMIHFESDADPEQVVLTVLPSQSIASLYDGAVNVASYGVAAEVEGVNGIRANPARAANARAIADIVGLRKLRYLDNEVHALGAVSWDRYQFEGAGNVFAVLDVGAGTSFDGASFKNLNVTGDFPGGLDFTYFENVGLQDVSMPVIAALLRCGLSGIIVYTGGVALFRDCFDSETPGVGPFVLDINGTPIAPPIEFRRFSGEMRIDNMTAGGGLDINLNGGTVEVDASCTGGAIKVYGTGRVINNSALVIDTSELIDSESLAILRAHKDAFVIDGGPGAANVVLDAEGLLLSARIRVFRTKAAAELAQKGAADGADGEIAAIDQSAINTGVAGQLANMDLTSQ